MKFDPDARQGDRVPGVWAMYSTLSWHVATTRHTIPLVSLQT